MGTLTPPTAMGPIMAGAVTLVTVASDHAEARSFTSIPPEALTLLTNKVRVAFVIRAGSDGSFERSNWTRPDAGVAPPTIFMLTAVPKLDVTAAGAALM